MGRASWQPGIDWNSGIFNFLHRQERGRRGAGASECTQKREGAQRWWGGFWIELEYGKGVWTECFIELVLNKFHRCDVKCHKMTLFKASFRFIFNGLLPLQLVKLNFFAPRLHFIADWSLSRGESSVLPSYRETSVQPPPTGAVTLLSSTTPHCNFFLLQKSNSFTLTFSLSLNPDQ